MIDYVDQMWELALNGNVQGVWFWAAVYTFIVCIYSLIYQLRVKAWPSTIGDIQRMGLSKFGVDSVLSEQDYVSDALYRYSIDGESYEGRRLSPWIIVASHNLRFILKRQLKGAQLLPNNQVKVFYKPSNPRKSFLILPSNLGIGVTLVLALLPAVTYSFRFYG